MDLKNKYSGRNTSLCDDTDRGPTGLGQYDGQGVYCGPHTASSVFRILVIHEAFPEKIADIAEYDK